MYITWLGQSCFKISAKGGSASDNKDQEINLITDPFSPDIGLKLPRNLTADIVTVSHDHFDHNYTAGVAGDPFVISQPGEYEIKNFFIYGIPSFHDNKKGAERGNNIIYRIEAEGLSIVHLGDIGHILSDEEVEKLDNVDVLLIPIGGNYTIGVKEAEEIINQLEPRIVIPMHYKIPGLKVDIDPLDKFAKEMGVGKKEALPKLKISKKDLPQEETQIIILEKA